MIILVELREMELEFIFLKYRISKDKYRSQVVHSSPEVLNGCWWNGR